MEIQQFTNNHGTIMGRKHSQDISKTQIQLQYSTQATRLTNQLSITTINLAKFIFLLHCKVPLRQSSLVSFLLALPSPFQISCLGFSFRHPCTEVLLFESTMLACPDCNMLVRIACFACLFLLVGWLLCLFFFNKICRKCGK